MLLTFFNTVQKRDFNEVKNRKQLITRNGLLIFPNILMEHNILVIGIYNINGLFYLLLFLHSRELK